MVTVIRPSCARCVDGTIARRERGVFFALKEGRNSRWGCVARDARGLALLGLDVRRPDHFAPLFGFLLKPPPVIRGRAAGDAAAQVGKPQLNLGSASAALTSLFSLSMISGGVFLG